MNEDQFRESLQRHMSDFVRGSMHFLGWNRFGAEIEDGQKVIHWRGLTIVRIPQIEDRVYLMPDINDREDLRAVMYVWELNNPDDPADSENQAAIIGLSIPSVQPGWMIARPEYDEFFDEDGNLIGQESEEETVDQAVSEKTAESEETAAAEEDAGPETPAETEQTAVPPRKENRPIREEEKAAGPATAKEKSQDEKTAKKTSAKKTAKDDTKEAYHMEEMEARLLEKEQILDRKIQQVEAERQRLLQLEAEAREKIKKMEEIRKSLETIKEERLLTVKERQNQYIDLMRSILQEHAHTVNELAKRKPYGLMTVNQIRIINEIFDKMRHYVGNSDGEDFLHLAEEPREDDLEHYPGTTYSEMALLINSYIHVYSFFYWGKLYMKTPDRDKTADVSAGDA